MKRFLLPLFFLLATGAVQAADHAAPQADAAKGQQIAAGICVACHNADGNSVIPVNPKLAGQHADYLAKQLREFKSGARPSPVMMGMSAGLSDDDMRNVAAWFAAQKPSGGETKDRETLAQAQKLYRGGDQAKGLPACAGCHGPAGAGIPAQYPRLAGQHADYIEAQLKSFRAAGADPKDTSARANDPNKMMRMVAVKMTDPEIKAVADYIAGLH
ncbi:cytochrome c4 [Denitratisoma sp. DHT3]|uniref:c-type cytochrome n=1 Tax=Denitratisoma sp. DHT3 TaxID=1981880 RepID=UPI001198C060|nr:c-type cytochrome [Denitratisoma sp. DHT3]QDX82399.1 cytochrome c4 [Denitratisoma sp. DHT3]